MKKIFIAVMTLGLVASASAAYQFEPNKKGGNEVWMTFDSETTVAFDLGRSGKDKDHENFIDRGEGVVDYGWYNMDTGESGSFNNGLSATFKENDRIGFYVKDNQGNTFVSTKEKYSPFDPDDWGKAHIVDGAVYLGGGNNGSNGTHEYYVFKINTNNNASPESPSGQPLPGIIAVLAVGGAALGIKKAYDKKKGSKAK